MSDHVEAEAKSKGWTISALFAMFPSRVGRAHSENLSNEMKWKGSLRLRRSALCDDDHGDGSSQIVAPHPSPRSRPTVSMNVGDPGHPGSCEAVLRLIVSVRVGRFTQGSQTQTCAAGAKQYARMTVG
jgi:hypothetical protein